MKLFLLTIFIALGFVFVPAQAPGRPSPTPSDPLGQAVQRGNEISRRSNDLRNIEKFPVKNDEDRRVYREQIEPLYRKLTDSEMETMAVSSEDLAANADFLKQKGTGIVRLAADRGCSASTGVVSADPQCLKYTMPGAGAAYSFRERRHRLTRLADINFKGNTFQALGALTHGIMVNIGDVPIENANLETNGAGFLVKLKPAKDIKKAAELATRLTKGIEEDGFRYASILAAKPNSTYLIRSIAYRGKAIKSAGSFVYNEFEFDDRRDVLVAFRVVRFAANQSITIVWKELWNKKSPTIKIK